MSVKHCFECEGTAAAKDNNPVNMSSLKSAVNSNRYIRQVVFFRISLFVAPRFFKVCVKKYNPMLVSICLLSNSMHHLAYDLSRVQQKPWGSPAPAPPPPPGPLRGVPVGEPAAGPGGRLGRPH